MSRATPRARGTGVARAALTIDIATGRLLVEGPASLPGPFLETLESLLGPGEALACAAPTALLTLPPASADELAAGSCVRLAGYWHDSLIEGPGRRSTAKFQGCALRCDGCVTPDSWDPTLGALVPAGRLADAVLDPSHARDGVSILGGEPFAQPDGLLALVRGLRERGCRHVLAYSGYTYERLHRMAAHRPAIGAVLDELDVLVDGPYVQALAGGAGPWTGSGNQRVIDLVATRARGVVVPWRGWRSVHGRG
jgi:anaerobic ribonucleoside-triphosphate reductase activating protein